jgi:hypothetical protein
VTDRELAARIALFFMIALPGLLAIAIWQSVGHH